MRSDDVRPDEVSSTPVTPEPSIDDKKKSRSELIAELEELRRRVADYEVIEEGTALAERLNNLCFLQNMERIDRAIRGAGDIESMLNDVLAEVLPIYECDRSFLLYPCDLTSATWRVPIEICRPEYPGALANGAEIPFDEETRNVVRLSLQQDGPLVFDPVTGVPIPPISAGRFQVRSQMMTVVYPKIGKPWLFGVHQCSYARVWSEEEQSLLQEIARRLGDSLTSLLILRDLRASEQRFRAITENTTDITVIIDQHGALRYASPAFEKLFAYTAGEIQGQVPAAFIVPQDLVKVRSIIEQAVAHPGASFRVDCFGVRHRDGTVLYLDGIFVSMADVEAVGGVVANCRDITLRKQAEEETRRLRNLLSGIVDSMPSVLVGVDRQGRVTQWNREAVQTTGIPPEQASGQHLVEVLPQLAGQMDKVERSMRERVPVKDPKQRRRVGGETRFEDITIYPLVTDYPEVTDEVDGAVIRIDDVTDRVRIEEMVIQSEKMLSVGGLAAGMAHEINNPLAGILQNVQVLRNRISSDLPSNRRVAAELGITMEMIASYMERRRVVHMVDTIMESGIRASKIVENMLTFSRKDESRLEPHDLRLLLDRTVDLASNDYNLKKNYDFRQIEIVRQYDPDLPPVHCEASKIQQVFLNLLTNGAQAMVSGARRPQQPRFILRAHQEEGWVRVEIEDNGPGMDETTRKRAFEPFFTTKGSGTGLGLSVSYYIITENHGGSLSVDSAPRRGSRFVIQLPLQ